MPSTSDTATSSAIDRFLGGNIAMIIDGVWQLHDMIKYTSFNVGIAAIPVKSTAYLSHTTTFTDEFFAVKTSKTPIQDQIALRYLQRAESIAALAEKQVGGFPVYKDDVVTYTAGLASSKIKDYLNVITGGLDSAVSVPYSTYYNIVDQRINQKMAPWINGEISAHGGAYVGSLDNAGQGVEFTYYAYESGTRNIDVYYTTGSVGSYHGIYVNGVYQSRFTYSTNTGWGSATAYNPASTSASVTLVKGWNTISVIKCGTASDSPSYGGWAELDYFVLHGLGQTYDPSTYSDPISYKYEAEEGYIHTDSVAPATSANASLGYIASGINVAGQGVDFNITIPAGTYQVKLSTGTTAAAVATINTDENTALNAKIALGTTTGWTDMALNANSVNVTFASSGAHTLKVTRESDSDWFTMDYVLLTPVA